MSYAAPYGAPIGGLGAYLDSAHRVSPILRAASSYASRFMSGTPYPVPVILPGWRRGFVYLSIGEGGGGGGGGS